jgi:hypothetical protein
MGRGSNNLMYGTIATSSAKKSRSILSGHQAQYQEWLEEERLVNYFDASQLAGQYLLRSFRGLKITDSKKEKINYPKSPEYKWLNDYLSVEIVQALKNKQRIMPRWEDKVLSLVPEQEREKINGPTHYPLSMSLVPKNDINSLKKYLRCLDPYLIKTFNNYNKQEQENYPIVAKMIANKTVDLVISEQKIERTLKALTQDYFYNNQGVHPDKIYSRQIYISFQQRTATKLFSDNLFSNKDSEVREKIAANSQIVSDLQKILYGHCQNYDKLKNIPINEFYSLANSLLAHQDRLGTRALFEVNYLRNINR